jgi:hypothetical protein
MARGARARANDKSNSALDLLPLLRVGHASTAMARGFNMASKGTLRSVTSPVLQSLGDRNAGAQNVLLKSRGVCLVVASALEPLTSAPGTIPK